jgi:hypothetical protein
MSRIAQRVSRRWFALAATLALAVSTPALAQNDQGSMKMKKDSSMMSHEAMMSHDGMMSNMTFMAATSHKAAGGYMIEEMGSKRRIALSGDFSVDKVPDPYLVLATSDAPDSKSVWVTKLRSVSGAQSYEIPSGTDLSQYHKLLVWCKKFGVLIASADLASSGQMMHQ